MGLQQFERRLERLVEGVFAKAFRSGVTPVEVAKRIAREMDAKRIPGVRGIIAPNRFVVRVSPSDHEQLTALSQTLARDLGEYSREHARTEGYRLVGPLEVVLEPAPKMSPGELVVDGEVAEAAGGGFSGSLVLADGSRIDVTAEPVTIGRLSDCDIVLSDSNVSRRHAEVRKEMDGYVVVDLGSLNGTKVNGKGIGGDQRLLNDGDEIRVGDTHMRFEVS